MKYGYSSESAQRELSYNEYQHDIFLYCREFSKIGSPFESSGPEWVNFGIYGNPEGLLSHYHNSTNLVLT